MTCCIDIHKEITEPTKIKSQPLKRPSVIITNENLARGGSSELIDDV